MVGAFIAVLFSIFVFALCGFHSYIIGKALTTQELLKKVYVNLPGSPFSTGRCFANWKKVICWPSITHTRLYYMLYLKHRDEEKFDRLRSEYGDQILPSEMVEQSIQIYEPPNQDNDSDGDREQVQSQAVKSNRDKYAQQEKDLIDRMNAQAEQDAAAEAEDDGERRKDQYNAIAGKTRVLDPD